MKSSANPRDTALTHGYLVTFAKGKKRRLWELIGGARRNRTDDLFNAIEALSQLSYGPDFQTSHARLRLVAKRASFSGAGV